MTPSELLNQQHTAEELPTTIESLNLAAADVADHITELHDLASVHEEQAAAEASVESNETKRKARRAEILRVDSAYQEIRKEIAEQERVGTRLQERAHRYTREHRLHIARCYQQAF
jgi:nicotinic acid mononucleotide adenylyltransferase